MTETQPKPVAVCIISFIFWGLKSLAALKTSRESFRVIVMVHCRYSIPEATQDRAYDSHCYCVCGFPPDSRLAITLILG